ncbi:hypothetical protein D3C78_1272680 [compost metagenome]
MTAAALDHGRRVVDGDDVATRHLDIPPHRQRGCTQRTSQVVNPTVGLHETLGQHANHGNDIGIAGNGTLDHVREHFSDAFVEGPVAQFGDWGRKKSIAVWHGGKSVQNSKAHMLTENGKKEQRKQAA